MGERSDLYAIFSGHFRFIKIGRSDSPETRLMTMQTGHPGELELLCTAIGCGVLEPAIHLIFEECRISREWYDIPRQHCLNIFEAIKTDRIQNFLRLLRRPENPDQARQFLKTIEVRRYLALVFAGVDNASDDLFLRSPRWKEMCRASPAPVKSK